MKNKMIIFAFLALYLLIGACTKEETAPLWEEVGTEVTDLYLEAQPKALISCERDYPIGSTRKIGITGEGTCFTGYGRCTYIGDGKSVENTNLKYVWKFYSKRTGACAYFTQDEGYNPVAAISTRFIQFYQPDITRLTVRPGRGGRLYVIAKTNTLVL